MLVLAQRYPFRRVIGIELVPALVLARRNTRPAGSRCTILGGDATRLALAVSFTSYLSGVFVASEVLKAAAWLETILAGRVPDRPDRNARSAASYAPQADSAWECVTTRRSIEEYRRAMDRSRQ